MCDKAVRMGPRLLQFVPGNLKTERICNEAVRNNPWALWHVPDQYNTQEMCDNVVGEVTVLLEYVPDWFVKQQQIDLWDNDDDYYDDDKLIEWYEGHQKLKTQKAKIKKELLPIA